jgi:putative endonuclease
MVPRDAFIAATMMSSRKPGTLYIGVTSNLRQRAWRHREGLIDGFAKKHGLKLVWFEQHEPLIAACARSRSRSMSATGRSI